MIFFRDEKASANFHLDFSVFADIPKIIFRGETNKKIVDGLSVATMAGQIAHSFASLYDQNEIFEICQSKANLLFLESKKFASRPRVWTALYEGVK